MFNTTTRFREAGIPLCQSTSIRHGARMARVAFCCAAAHRVALPPTLANVRVHRYGFIQRLPLPRPATGAPRRHLRPRDCRRPVSSARSHTRQDGTARQRQRLHHDRYSSVGSSHAARHSHEFFLDATESATTAPHHLYLLSRTCRVRTSSTITRAPGTFTAR